MITLWRQRPSEIGQVLGIVTEYRTTEIADRNAEDSEGFTGKTGQVAESHRFFTGRRVLIP